MSVERKITQNTIHILVESNDYGNKDTPIFNSDGDFAEIISIFALHFASDLKCPDNCDKCSHQCLNKYRHEYSSVVAVDWDIDNLENLAKQMKPHPTNYFITSISYVKCYQHYQSNDDKLFAINNHTNNSIFIINASEPVFDRLKFYSYSPIMIGKLYEEGVMNGEWQP